MSGVRAAVQVKAFHVGVVVVLRHRRGDRILALGGDKQDGALEPDGMDNTTFLGI